MIFFQICSKFVPVMFQIFKIQDNYTPISSNLFHTCISHGVINTNCITKRSPQKNIMHIQSIYICSMVINVSSTRNSFQEICSPQLCFSHYSDLTKVRYLVILAIFLSANLYQYKHSR